MMDLHSHSFMSDGVATPIEQVRYAQKNGLIALAITDHADFTNFETLSNQILKLKRDFFSDFIFLAGLEITHVHPEKIGIIVSEARALGINWIGVHGETPVEPVIKGTNRAAIEAGVDFLAHPGFITDEDTELAAKKGIFLELTLRSGHSLTNGFVYQQAKKFNASIIINSDGHKVSELLNENLYKAVAFGAGMSESELELHNQKLFQYIQKK
ncbi:histidinol phosphate phosphatase domain-containing protein [bacterium]|nr:histidinol phosphate phosphatase domain-containing protein [bacterium]